MTSCRITANRVAPSAKRAAISRRRPAKRASSEIGDVRARDQEHTSHGAEEQQITLPLLADRIVQERHDVDLRRRVDVGGVRGAVIGGDDVHRSRACSSDTPGRSLAVA